MWLCWPLGFSLLLVSKLHQEECEDIKGLIWRVCVSYRPPNSVTRSFEFPIPRCTDNIEDFDDSNDPIYFISLDLRLVYYQVRVCKSNQEKLDFFTPSGKKKTFKVMSFGPKNAPTFYTVMTQVFEWWLDPLFSRNETYYCYA